MTIVEFYDKNHIANIAGALSCNPDRVVFITNSTKQIEDSIRDYKKVFELRNIKSEIIVRSVNRNDIEKAVDALNDIVNEDSDCHFDLEGGDELYLVALGKLYERLGDKINLHRYNVNNNTFSDCDKNGVVITEKKINLSVYENILIYGGKAVSSEKTPQNDEEKNDVKRLWDICRVNASKYNSQINALGAADKIYLEAGSLSVSINLKDANKKLADGFVLVPQILRSLEKAGLISELQIGDHTISLKYKSEFVRRLLRKAGNCLEQYICLVCSELLDFNDVKTGVTIDWDGNIGEKNAEVENEIDILAMSGTVPVFVSCKNGSIETDELYKVSLVAERFGGEYAKKVIVVSELFKMGSKADYIRLRAEEMGIRLIENAAELSEQEICDIFKQL